MNQLVKKNLTKSKKTSLFIIIVFSLIFTVSPIAIHAIFNMYHHIHADIIEHSRGSYDILVRSPNAITEIEKELGMVPENYLGGGLGGISLEQWEEIKNREDIEIAAPVASLGYFTGINTTLGILPSPEGPSSYRVTYSTSDGVNDYLYTTFEQVFLEPLGGPFSHEVLVNQPEMLSFTDDRRALFPLPITYHHLVAIDSIEENKLTGISFTEITTDEEEKGIAQGWGADSDLLESVHIIPVMQLQDSDILVKADIEIGKLPFTQDDTRNFLNRYDVTEFTQMMNFGDPSYEEFFKIIRETPKTNEISHDLNLTGWMKPFNAEASGIVVDENGKLIDMEEYAESTNYGYTVNWNNITTYYLAHPVSYEQTEHGLRVSKLGEENGIPLYRSIEKKGIGIREASQNYDLLDVMTDAIGYYEIADKEASLASSPLGIYQLEPVTYVDELGNEITLSPTFTAGSFVTAPAEGVTNIESAEFVKGEQPIDAIRVKVSGFNDYSPEAAKEIEQIATEISEMGLHVDIVAGSSLQKIDVEVEGIGTVQESWTTLGASGKIVGQWDLTNFLLALIFSFTAILYVINRMTIWTTEKTDDIERYKTLGWEYSHIKKLFQREITIILIAAIGLSSVILTSFMHTDEHYLAIIFLHFILDGLLVILIFFLMNKQLNRVLQGRGLEKTSKVKETSSLILRNILYYRKSIFSTFLQILVVSSLVSVVYLSLTESVSQSNHTVLGQYINAGLNDWNQLILYSTFILTIITLIESISAMLIARKEEIHTFKILGWNLSSINSMYMKEITLWSGIALAMGSVLSFLLFFSFYPVNLQNVLFILLTAIGLYLIIFMVASIILKIRLKQSYA